MNSVGRGIIIDFIVCSLRMGYQVGKAQAFISFGVGGGGRGRVDVDPISVGAGGGRVEEGQEWYGVAMLFGRWVFVVAGRDRGGTC